VAGLIKLALEIQELKKAFLNMKMGHVLSIAGIEKDDWIKFSDKIPDNFNLEINMSCPNIDEHYTGGIETFDPTSREWFIGKISPLTTFQELEYFINVLKFKQIHACNTLPVEKGGLSGKELIPYTTKFIKHIKNNYPEISIIAGGGIYTKKDSRVLSRYRCRSYKSGNCLL
jgi:dihydroorotate dehydrogenase